MLVIHAHWQPPTTPTDPGKVIFWAETSAAGAPAWRKGRLPKNPRPVRHPFCASQETLQALFGKHGRPKTLALRLPTTRTGPRPSPELVHTWDLDQETAPFLAPWLVTGIVLPAYETFHRLVELPALGQKRNGQEEPHRAVGLGADANFWHFMSGLVLETLAAQKLVPVLAPVDAAGTAYHARWLPVLDGPKDGPRLAQLEAALPAVCRSASRPDESAAPSPRALLTTFLNTFCDLLARRWAQPVTPRLLNAVDGPVRSWLEALFKEDPTVKGSPAQLQALALGWRAWMRNLHVAGDANFRIAFRLEAPPAQAAVKDPEWQLHYLLQARDDPSLLVPAETVWKKTSRVLAEPGRRFENPQEKLLGGLGYAARLFPPIAGSLKDKAPTRLSIDTQAAYQFLREVAPLLEGAGFGLLVPPWWNRRGARLGLRMKMQSKKGQENVGAGHMTFENLVRYEWELAVGDTALTQAEFKALAALKSPLVQIRGQWVQLDADQVEAAIRFWEKQQTAGEMGLLDALQYSLDEQTGIEGLPVEDIQIEGWLADWFERFNQPETLSELPPPGGLHAELRPYQRFGYSWLNFHRRMGLGVCLADDMGLGKTIQTIALLLHEKESHGRLPAPALVICPTSVVTNWEREIRRFAPSLTTLVHQGAGRLRGRDFTAAACEVDMVLTSYPLARQDAEILQSLDWLAVILDEAQNIKNPAAKQTQAVRELSANFRLALTGTPVENRLSELWSIMHFLNPGYLGSRKKFHTQFALPIERYNDEESLKRLRQLTRPFILRRMKTDRQIIQDLPEKVETKVYCHLTEEQATLYEAVVQDAMQQIEANEGIQRRGQVLSMLMQLKQICNHPAQYLHQVEADGVPEAEIRGVSATSLGARSGKLERLNELLEEILAREERALIFTQFAEMGQLLHRYLPQAVGAAALFLHGGTPAKTRDQMVRRFQEDVHGPPLFILSLKAGGTGLNLTRANHVFHFDRWWNPAVEDQATDRAFRIGQQRNVQVHKFVTTGTLEEKIDDMIESKKELAQAVVGRGENWLTELSTQDLRELVRLRRQ